MNCSVLPVLGSVVLVLGLDDKTLTGIVIGLAFTPPPELHLEALEVSFILDHLHKTLQQNTILVDQFSSIARHSSINILFLIDTSYFFFKSTTPFPIA